MGTVACVQVTGQKWQRKFFVDEGRLQLGLSVGSTETGFDCDFTSWDIRFDDCACAWTSCLYRSDLACVNGSLTWRGGASARMAKRTILFGIFASAHRVVYKSASNSYELFVNRFVADFTRETHLHGAIAAVNAAWPSYKDDPKKNSEVLDRGEARASTSHRSYGFRVLSERPTPNQAPRPQRENSGSVDEATSSSTAAISLDVLASSSKSNVRDGHNESAISSCLELIGVDAEPFLTEDVPSLSLFMSAL